jgi:hypothetical protein
VSTVGFRVDEMRLRSRLRAESSAGLAPISDPAPAASSCCGLGVLPKDVVDR